MIKKNFPIIEACDCLVKVNSMFFQISLSFVVIPLKHKKVYTKIGNLKAMK